MAAATTYTTIADVTPYLPANYSDTDLSLTHLNAMILEVSRTIDARLHEEYITFNSTTGTPATPSMIQRLAKRMVAAQALHHLAIGDRNTSLIAAADGHAEYADSVLDLLVNRATSLPPETITGATLTKGTGGTYDIQTNEAFIGVEALISTSGEIPTIIESQTKVTTTGLTQYNYGDDFFVRFDTRHQKWVFVDNSNSLLAGSPAVAATINYVWTWQRYSGARASARVRSGAYL